MSNLIGINAFVTRQTAESKFSHYEGTFRGLAALTEEYFSQAKPGYRDGVLLVPVPAFAFCCGVVEVTAETELKASLVTRREGEKPYIDVVAVGGEKLFAKAVDIVIYRRDVLLEDGPDAVSTDCEWEIVSINARATEDPEPMTPIAMARNMLGLPGGTKAEYTAEEFAKAILYWSTRAMKG